MHRPILHANAVYNKSFIGLIANLHFFFKKHKKKALKIHPPQFSTPFTRLNKTITPQTSPNPENSLELNFSFTSGISSLHSLSSFNFQLSTFNKINFSFLIFHYSFK